MRSMQLIIIMAIFHESKENKRNDCNILIIIFLIKVRGKRKRPVNIEDIR